MGRFGFVFVVAMNLSTSLCFSLFSLCVFVNPRVFVCVHTCAYISVYIGMQIRARAWVHTHVCAHMLLCLGACLYTCGHCYDIFVKANSTCSPHCRGSSFLSSAPGFAFPLLRYAISVMISLDLHNHHRPYSEKSNQIN